jgi:hypothetical protein
MECIENYRENTLHQFLSNAISFAAVAGSAGAGSEDETVGCEVTCTDQTAIRPLGANGRVGADERDARIPRDCEL